MGHFNPRSPCGERPNLVFMSSMAISFQSTLPVRGATAGGCERMIAMLNFNPRSPCGERRKPVLFRCIRFAFQSTLPVRGATAARQRYQRPNRRISIHAPRAGSDGSGIAILRFPEDFNPRSPCGERQRQGKDISDRTGEFQSTLPVRGATVRA